MQARPPPAACEEIEVGAVHGGRHLRVKLRPEGAICFAANLLPRTVLSTYRTGGTDVRSLSLNLKWVNITHII